MTDRADGTADAVFAGKGEVASLLRAIDWSTTPLGSVDSWPSSLRTALSICLGSRHPIVLWWGRDRSMFYNDAYRPMLGGKHPQFLGRPGEECWTEIWSIIGPMMDQVLETGDATWSEDLFLLMLRSGYLEETYFTFSYSPIRDEDGRPVGIFNACTETTGRVLADRRIRTLREMTVDARSVDAAATRCVEVLGRNPRDLPFALLYLVDDDGDRLVLAAAAGLAKGSAASPRVVSLNASADEGGWPLGSVIASGRPVLVDRLGGRFADLPKEPWDEAAHQAMLLPIPRPGTDRPAGALILGISPRRVFDDDYRGFFDLVAANVATALANSLAHEEQRSRAEKLAELDRVKTTFFSNVSHEFRTPLTLILGPLEEALGQPAGLHGASLEAVHRNALRLLQLVNSLLDFSRLEASRREACFGPTDLAILTGGLVGSFQSLVESAGLELVVDCPPLPEPVYVDRSQWEKIVLNLVSNAFKFTFEGTITVRLRTINGSVELSVSDTGVGIPEHELSRVFERFHRVEGARGRSFEGTGIGLALVQELTIQHGGRVGVESTLGKGSTFTVQIPRGRAHLPTSQIVEGAVDGGRRESPSAFVLEAAQWLRAGRSAAPAPAPSSPTRPASDRARVLVVDDNADMRSYLERLLGTRWAVEVTSDGEAALVAALASPPDLVLTDVMMPKLDGVGLLRALRCDARTSTIPVVLLSARAGEEEVVNGLETGADDYLVKPFSARELLSRVATHLELARLRRRETEAAIELADTREQLLLDLDRKNKELEAFSYSVSHDLRSPLRTLDGFSQILLEDHATQLDEEGKQHLTRIRSAAQRMGALIDALLELSYTGRRRLEREDVSLSGLARRIAENLARSEPRRSVEIVVADGLRIDADPRLSEILLENLLGNAWKFTSKIAEARIEVGVALEAGERVFFVRDNGAGFDPQDAGRLFTPFQRLHTMYEFPGTGIGLATVRRIVERHGGRVWAEGRPNGGATIRWTFEPRPEPRSSLVPRPGDDRSP